MNTGGLCPMVRLFAVAAMIPHPMQRTIIVGDVHGCAEELRLLLRKCGYAKGDRLVLAGDLVAKGPDSQGVVQFARENSVLAVLGNHDAFALAHKNEADKDRSQDRRNYIRSLGAEDWAYLEALPDFLRLGDVRPGGPEVLVVHAGLVPGIPVDEQRKESLRSLRSIADTGEPGRSRFHRAPLHRRNAAAVPSPRASPSDPWPQRESGHR